MFKSTRKAKTGNNKGKTPRKKKSPKSTKKAPPLRKNKKYGKSTGDDFENAYLPRNSNLRQRGVDRPLPGLESANTIRDISRVPPVETNRLREIDFSAINWERRLACKADPILDLKTYFPNIFQYPFGSGHENLIHECEEIIQDGGKKIMTCPRRFGKSAICRALIIRAMKYGLRDFLFFVGSKEPKAIQTLDAVKGLWHRNPLLYQDFPEFSYPIYRINGRGGMGTFGQEWKGTRTYIGWSADELMLASLVFTKKDVQPYLDNDPDSVIYLPDRNIEIDAYTIKGAGCICRVAGIDGSIRGEADFHPIFLTQPRPDLILLDDIVRDQKADSPTSSQKLEGLVESVIDFLAAPGVSQGILWPGTVIREGDPTDNYSDRIKHPEWQADRISLITQYPEGFDDDTIPQKIEEDKDPSEQKIQKTDYSEETYEQGRLWNEYADILQQSLLKYGTYKTANKFYTEHRDTLERGFKIAWEHMHVQTSRNPDKNEVSTIQHAMNKRFLDHPSFLSEIQNRPKTLVSQGSLVLTAGFIREKQTGIPQNVVSEQWTILSSFIDVQGEILFYGVLATDNDFNGQFIDYGTFPRVGTDYFRKNQTYGWKALSKLFKRRNPKELENVNRPRPPKSGYEAPLEARIYLALEMCCDDLLSRKFEIEDSNLGEASISAIAIDTKWGESSETVKRFIREYGDNRVKSYGGQSFGPGMRQLEEYEPRPGWLFEHQLHPHVKESKWCVKPYEKSKIKQNYIQADVSRLKSELMRRLATPLGSAQGCITLFNASPIRHKMFAEHLADSQFPEPTTARDVTKDIWKPKPGGVNDDDFLDVAAGCLAVASIQGASIKSKKHKKRKKTKQKTLRDMYNDRKQRTDGPAGRRPTK